MCKAWKGIFIEIFTENSSDPSYRGTTLRALLMKCTVTLITGVASSFFLREDSAMETGLEVFVRKKKIYQKEKLFAF